jgi:hypothetical protein
VQPISEAVLLAFSAMATQAGYIAGQLKAGGSPTPALANRRLA